MAPLAELLGQGAVCQGLIVMREPLQALMHQIEGVIDQLSSLFKRHGQASGGNAPLLSRLTRPKCDPSHRNSVL
jgi:hypothetical protein